MDALPELVNPRTGRVHTSYNQAGAATGRLSSTNPNLQNIPIRTEVGREVRRAFMAEPGHVLWPPTTRRSSCACWPTSPGTHTAGGLRQRQDIHAARPPAVRRAVSQVTTDQRRWPRRSTSPSGTASGLGLSQRTG